MLISTYNPDSQAICPNCKKSVHCWLTGGNMWTSPRYLELAHECGEQWKYYVDYAEQVRVVYGDPLFQWKKSALYQWASNKTSGARL